MTDKKQQIIEAALKLFADKGYHATSIQEIAQTLGIAKGSVYVYFKSKEELLVSICKHYSELMAGQFREIAANSRLSPRERLIAFVVLQNDHYVQYGDLIKMLLQERVVLNGEIGRIVFALSAELLRGYRSVIVELYGEQAEPYSYDAANLFEAMVGSYMKLVFLGHGQLDFVRIANYLAGRLDDIVSGLLAQRPQPILGAGDIAAADGKGLFGGSAKRTAFDEIDALREAVERLALKPAQTAEIESALQVLEGELRKPEPQTVVARGMLALLKNAKLDGLHETIERIEAYL